MAASAQDAPPGSSPADPSKSGESPHAGERDKPSGQPKTTEADAPRKETQKLAESDLAIMAQYHHDNQVESQLGKAAATRAERAEVKAFGEMLARDHSNLDKQMMGLARKSGQAIPAVTVKDDAAKAQVAQARQRAAEIQKLQGERFEREFLAFVVENHSRILSNIDAHIAAAQNPQVAEVLRKARPNLQQHHDRARELQQDEPQPME
jgi:putative membrane protein